MERSYSLKRNVQYFGTISKMLSKCYYIETKTNFIGDEYVDYGLIAFLAWVPGGATGLDTLWVESQTISFFFFK